MEKQTENQQEIDKITDNKTITALEEKRLVWEITRIESESILIAHGIILTKYFGLLCFLLLAQVFLLLGLLDIFSQS
jgi:hypothetical protein